MTDFSDMTPEELQASMQADLYRFIMEQLHDRAREEHAGAISDYLGSWEQHIGLIFDPLTEDAKRSRRSVKTRLAPKTAWGWMWMQKMAQAQSEAMPFEFSIVVDDAPYSPPKRA